MSPIEWRELLIPDHPLLEIFLRGSIVFLSLFIMLRLILKREIGTIGLTDLVLIVLLGNALQNAIASNYQSITEGLLLMVIILFWSYALNWLSYHFAFIRRWIQPPPLLLIKDGQILQRNLRQELLTREELMALLRQQGVESPDRVRKAFMENDGRLSIISSETNRHSPPPQKGPDG